MAALASAHTNPGHYKDLEKCDINRENPKDHYAFTKVDMLASDNFSGEQREPTHEQWSPDFLASHGREPCRLLPLLEYESLEP